MAARPRTDGKPPRTAVEKAPHPAVQRIPADSETGVGRPEVTIDEAALYELAKTHASFEQMGKILGVGSTTLSNNIKFRTIIEKARAEREKDLLSAQFKTAIDDRNPTMQIWLGKQYLGQKDVHRVENTGADGKPMEVNANVRAVAYFPANGRNRKLPVGTATDEAGNDLEVEEIGAD